MWVLGDVTSKTFRNHWCQWTADVLPSHRGIGVCRLRPGDAGQQDWWQSHESGLGGLGKHAKELDTPKYRGLMRFVDGQHGRSGMLWKTFEQQHFGLTHRIWGDRIFGETCHGAMPHSTTLRRLYAFTGVRHHEGPIDLTWGLPGINGGAHPAAGSHLVGCFSSLTHCPSSL